MDRLPPSVASRGQTEFLDNTRTQSAKTPRHTTKWTKLVQSMMDEIFLVHELNLDGDSLNLAESPRTRDRQSFTSNTTILAEGSCRSELPKIIPSRDQSPKQCKAMEPHFTLTSRTAVHGESSKVFLTSRITLRFCGVTMPRMCSCWTLVLRNNCSAKLHRKLRRPSSVQKRGERYNLDLNAPDWDVERLILTERNRASQRNIWRRTPCGAIEDCYNWDPTWRKKIEAARSLPPSRL